jgi:hypothetical protein
MQAAVHFKTNVGLRALRGSERAAGCATASAPQSHWHAPYCTCRGGSFGAQRPVPSPREIHVGQGRAEQALVVARQGFEGASPLFAKVSAAIGIQRMQTRTPNLSLKLSANGVPRWLPSAGPAAHFALAIQRATPLALRLALR